MSSAVDAIKTISKDRAWVTPKEAAAALGSTEQTIRVTARQRPELLGFRVAFVGNRCKISAKSLLDFLEGRK